MNVPRVRIFIASSLDGFIAGPDDELDWLAPGEGVEDTFTPFLSEVGALLMGRRTHDVVQGFPGEWPYGERPVLVATSRPLESSTPTVRAVSGPMEALVAEAKAAAGDRDVYLDGGALCRSALAAGLVDEITITLFPIVLGAGQPLFAGVEQRHGLELIHARELGAGLVELKYAYKRSA